MLQPQQPRNRRAVEHIAQIKNLGPDHQLGPRHQARPHQEDLQGAPPVVLAFEHRIVSQLRQVRRPLIAQPALQSAVGQVIDPIVRLPVHDGHGFPDAPRLRAQTQQAAGPEHEGLRRLLRCGEPAIAQRHGQRVTHNLIGQGRIGRRVLRCDRVRQRAGGRGIRARGIRGRDPPERQGGCRIALDCELTIGRPQRGKLLAHERLQRSDVAAGGRIGGAGKRIAGDAVARLQCDKPVGPHDDRVEQTPVHRWLGDDGVLLRQHLAQIHAHRIGHIAVASHQQLGHRILPRPQSWAPKMALKGKFRGRVGQPTPVRILDRGFWRRLCRRQNPQKDLHPFSPASGEKGSGG